MGNILTEWMAFRLGQKKKTAAAGLRAKAGSKLFAGVKKSQDGLKNKLKGGKKDEADDEDEDEEEEEEEEEEEQPAKRKGAQGKAAMAKTRGGRGGGEVLANKTVAIRIDDLEEPLEVVGWVVALNGNHRGQDFRLHTDKNVLGTAADCDIVLTDPYLSSRHATIRHDPTDGRFTIIDLDSTNGTYLNEKRISKDELIDNDTLRLGRTELKFKALF